MKTMNDSVIVKAPLAGKQGRDFRPLLRMVALHLLWCDFLALAFHLTFGDSNASCKD